MSAVEVVTQPGGVGQAKRVARGGAVTDNEHPLFDLLWSAACGRFPSGEQAVRVPRPPPQLAGAVVAFSGCTYVAADVKASDVRARLGSNPLVGPVLPAFLEWLAHTVGGNAQNNEVVLAGIGTGRVPPTLGQDPGWRDHERSKHGSALRRDVTGWTFNAGEGIVLVGRGLVGRWEVGYEAAAGAPLGTGRAMAAAALGLIPEGEPLFAQISPGHAQSLRAALAAGYQPVSGEVLLTHHEHG